MRRAPIVVVLVLVSLGRADAGVALTPANVISGAVPPNTASELVLSVRNTGTTTVTLTNIVQGASADCMATSSAIVGDGLPPLFLLPDQQVQIKEVG